MDPQSSRRQILSLVRLLISTHPLRDIKERRLFNFNYANLIFYVRFA